MQTFFVILCCIFSAVTVQAACNSSMPASTPDSQLVDNNNNTVTDLKTGLMWKQCVEGRSGSDCTTGTVNTFTSWQEALQRPATVNTSGGFAGYTDWRLPNIRELVSIVEEQCYDPAINLNRFPNTPGSAIWSGSPSAGNSGRAWFVGFSDGNSYDDYRGGDVYAVRLVRGGQ
ncbi:DUF1566 domain-containing protein [Desulfobulbus sp. TB]|nr:DUF1566 domain-containing protein [Desulfobulbus sp. TB]